MRRLRPFVLLKPKHLHQGATAQAQPWVLLWLARSGLPDPAARPHAARVAERRP